MTKSPMPIVPLNAIAGAVCISTGNPKRQFNRLTGEMMPFELSVKSIVVEQPMSEVTPGIIVVGYAPAVNALMIAATLVRPHFQRTVQPLQIAFKDRHPVGMPARTRYLVEK